MSSIKSDTRNRILQATLQLMLECNGQGVRIEDVAQAVGISRQAVYLHFPTRTDLLVAAARYTDDVYGNVEQFRQQCNVSNGVELLEAYVDFWAGYLPKIYGLARALMNAQQTDEAAAAAWHDRMQALRDGCHDVIRRLADEHTLSIGWDEPEAIDFMWTMLLVPTWENLTQQCGWTSGKYARRMKTALKKILVK